jgi:hypothetical protein
MIPSMSISGSLTMPVGCGEKRRDIAGAVASMTEDDPGLESERFSYNALG